jgi:hypothetical protein
MSAFSLSGIKAMPRLAKYIHWERFVWAIHFVASTESSCFTTNVLFFCQDECYYCLTYIWLQDVEQWKIGLTLCPTFSPEHRHLSCPKKCFIFFKMYFIDLLCTLTMSLMLCNVKITKTITLRRDSHPRPSCLVRLTWWPLCHAAMPSYDFWIYSYIGTTPD